MSEERKGKGKTTASDNPPMAVADGDKASAGSMLGLDPGLQLR